MSSNPKFNEKVNSIIEQLNQISSELVELREMINQPELVSEKPEDHFQVLENVESLSPALYNTLQLLKKHSPINANEMAIKTEKGRSSESMRLNQLVILGYATSYNVGRIKYFQIQRV